MTIIQKLTDRHSIFINEKNYTTRPDDARALRALGGSDEANDEERSRKNMLPHM